MDPTVLLYVPEEAGDLGNYIFCTNPYQAGYPPKGTWLHKDKAGPPGTVTLIDEGCDHDPPYSLDFAGNELHERPGEWKFKYADHYVARAVRVPYMYYQKSKADPTIGVLVRDYFLIGFEGGGAY
jgi:hypothetical protein